MDIWSGVPFRIEELPGKFKGYGELSHAVNPQTLRIRNKIDFWNMGFGTMGREFPRLREFEFK